MSRKKILHVSAGGLGVGGVASVIYSIVKSLHKNVDFSFVVFSRKSDNELTFKQFGELYRINCYPNKGKRDYIELITRPFKLYFGIRNICKHNKFDVIHCHNQKDASICLLAAKHEKVPVRIAHSHVANDCKKKNFIEKIYKKISSMVLLNVSTHRIGCSEAACKQLFNSNDFDVVYNSIDTNKFNEKLKLSHDGINFIHVGRFNYAKNQEFLLEVFAEVTKVLNDVHLFLVGHGDYKSTNNLKRIIKELNVEKYVEMIPGNLVDVVDYYKLSDYMIFPSRFEGFGIVLLEAQSMGIPCYVSDIIQSEVDLGLLSYISLTKSPKEWAEIIVNDIKANRNYNFDQNKILKYSNEVICQFYKDIYGIEQDD